PNAFKHNNDGLNDSWNIPALDAYPNFELFVFNRYGEVVFKNSKVNKSWDGSFKLNPLPAGAYPYFIKLNVDNKILKGTVMIIH
ncbi:MAG TPA: gliding motility-associated C-terminal domain-containing protein, partial [Ferruginibacter sp.]|nr:gliding motility-associated C-terminal domain-containing protein [Ferruginibacter sp.]